MVASSNPHSKILGLPVATLAVKPWVANGNPAAKAMVDHGNLAGRTTVAHGDLWVYLSRLRQPTQRYQSGAPATLGKVRCHGNPGTKQGRHLAPKETRDDKHDHPLTLGRGHASTYLAVGRSGTSLPNTATCAFAPTAKGM